MFLQEKLLLTWIVCLGCQVMPNWDTAADKHRYTFTIWMTSDNPGMIANPDDKFHPLRHAHFPEFAR